jgi:hypothetical protein
MFQKATRENIKIKIAVLGPSGSGKTFSSLKIAKGLGKKIAVIDTENNSASLYSNILDFDVCKLSEPYTSKKFIDAINFAVKEGYDTIVVDSISHEWAGQGGILDRKTIKDSIGGNSYTNWKDFTKEHNDFISCVLNSNANIICTMRSKTDYIMIENEKGKMMPKKVGLAPIQREGVDYEYSIVFDIAQNHIASVSKDRTGIFDGRNFLIDESIGEEIKTFITSGAEIKKSLKEIVLEKTSLLKDEALKARIIETVTGENDIDKIKKFDERVDEILAGQKA